MRKKIIRITCFFVLLVTLALLGCGAGEISTDTLKNEFPKKMEFMQEVVEQCEKYPALSRVGVEEEDVRLYADYSSSKDINAAVRLIRDRLTAVSASKVECLRRADFGHKLVAVSFTMWTTGISVSGILRGYLYRTEWMETNFPLSEQARSEAGFIVLGVPGWYVMDID